MPQSQLGNYPAPKEAVVKDNLQVNNEEVPQADDEGISQTADEVGISNSLSDAKMALEARELAREFDKTRTSFDIETYEEELKQYPYFSSLHLFTDDEE